MESNMEGALPKPKKDKSKSPRPSKKSRKMSSQTSEVNTKDNTDLSAEDQSNQLIIYNPEHSNDESQDALAVSENMENHSANRILPSIGAFTVQCATCFKWRLIPTKEKYEEIRENILQEPFVCERAREWRPDISCEDPEDISQDGSRLWAIDKPNIAQPPPGWERLLRIRGEGSTKFADVYYASPTGKRLRSMVEIQRYLIEHPEYIKQGVNLSQFSFQIPRPLQENYVRKRAPRMTNPLDGSSLGLSRPLEPEEVNPLSWAAPPTRRELETGGSVSPPPSSEPVEPSTSSEMEKTVKPRDDPICDEPNIKLEESELSRSTSSLEL
uniref:Methyl-CpG-binding domain-containing protein 2-like n=1 Tax=Ananas comosus var. bracteatus TaxID=296719 RepID=A0A6V7P443_ANACO|nr:unnamed protein product [Ananas comosus var. bracteatus]